MSSISRAFRACSVDGCLKPVRKVGMCSSCYSLKMYHNKRVLKNCILCGIKLDNNKKIYCPECRRKRDLERDKKYQAVRRATGVRRLNVQEYDALMDRSGGKCGICSFALGSFNYPHPLSIAIDHVKPVALGGRTEISNLQMAHSWCNVMKKDSPGNFFKNSSATFSPDLAAKLLDGCGYFGLTFQKEQIVMIDTNLFDAMKTAYLREQEGML